jgi:hypothetical protein
MDYRFVVYREAVRRELNIHTVSGDEIIFRLYSGVSQNEFHEITVRREPFSYRINDEPWINLRRRP